MKTNSYKDLTVWQKGIELVEEVYSLTQGLPDSEKFGLSSQIRRAVISIPSNLAEGYKRQNIREYIQFCSIAEASLAEVETQLIIIGRIYPAINSEKSLLLTAELQKMLYAFIKALRTKRYTLNAIR